MLNKIADLEKWYIEKLFIMTSSVTG
jgi:hypothetical protein